ncbi:MAG: hypothetical protein ACLPY1_21775 [Terracidiphilus sp.]
MFGKDWDVRWNATINYLNNNIAEDNLGTHINSIVPQASRKAISGELSLGSRPDGEDDPEYANNTRKRDALRALLLCQRVYYSGEFWAKQSEDGQGLHVVPVGANALLKSGWKKLSLQHWKNQSEAQIREGIRMFVYNPAATRADLQAAAFAGPPNGTPLPGNLTLSRLDNYAVGSGVTCYVGVQGWLVKSGLVSMRWFMRNCAPNKQVGCDLVFGAGQEVWNGPIKDEDKPRLRQVINGIGAGHVVHIWSPQNYNWNGHWVVTNGDPNKTICGVNNAEFNPNESELGVDVQKNYTNNSTLFEQFIDGYGGQLDGKGWKTGVMAVIDPLQMPNRN